MEKRESVVGKGDSEDVEVELLIRERRSLNILSVKKEARLSASALAIGWRKLEVKTATYTKCVVKSIQHGVVK